MNSAIIFYLDDNQNKRHCKQRHNVETFYPWWRLWHQWEKRLQSSWIKKRTIRNGRMNRKRNLFLLKPLQFSTNYIYCCCSWVCPNFVSRSWKMCQKCELSYLCVRYLHIILCQKYKFWCLYVPILSRIKYLISPCATLGLEINFIWNLSFTYSKYLV